MKRWVRAARVLETLATAEQEGGTRLSAVCIARRSGVRFDAVVIVLGVLEHAQLVEGHRDESTLLAWATGERRVYRLTDKARRFDEVFPLLFGPRMGACRVTRTIVAVLRSAGGGRADGWIPGHVVARVVQENHRWRQYRTRAALDWLEADGLVERRDTTAADPGPWNKDYRLRLPWAPSASEDPGL